MRGRLRRIAVASRRGHRCTRPPRGSGHRSRRVIAATPGSQLGLPADRFVLAVFGGSLGSQRLNEIVVQTVERLVRSSVTWPSITSSASAIWPAAAPARDGAHGIMYRVLGYEDRMPLVYAAADLMMTRAGAATIAELATVGMPAVIVPWPGAAENHQVDNARELSDQQRRSADRRARPHRRPPGRRDRTHDGRPRTTRRRCRHAAARIGRRHRSGALIDLIERVASP